MINSEKTKRFLNSVWGRETIMREDKENALDFMELLEEDREAFIRSAYMTGLYMYLERLQWAIMTDEEWKGGMRAISYIKIQNMMNQAYKMISPEYSYLLDEELAEWTEERRKREEI